MWTLPPHHLKSKLVRAEERREAPLFLTCSLPCSFTLGNFPFSWALFPPGLTGTCCLAFPSVWYPTVPGCRVTVRLWIIWHAQHFLLCHIQGEANTYVQFKCHSHETRLQNAVENLVTILSSSCLLLQICENLRKGSHVLTTRRAQESREGGQQPWARHRAREIHVHFVT